MSVIHVWTQTDRHGQVNKIRQHNDNRFDVIGFNFVGKRGSYGSFESLTQAKKFCETYDGLLPSEWEKVK